MFDKIKGAIGRAKNYIGGIFGMKEPLNLTTVTDHPKIKLAPSELVRVSENKEFFKNIHDDVVYYDSNNDLCTRPYNAVNLSKTVSRKLAKLVFNEGFNAELSTEDAQEFIDSILENNRFNQVFGEELEGGYAISGLAIVPVFDDMARAIKFVYCSADNFIPLDGNTNLVRSAAILNHYRDVKDGEIVYYTLFAFHEPYGVVGTLDQQGRPAFGYVIRHELYESKDPNTVGKQVSLKACEETAHLEDNVYMEGRGKPLFVYIKLAGKNNVNYGSPLGLGVIDNAKRQLINFNDKYDLYMNEIDTATRQLVASSEFFNVSYGPDGNPRRTFNPRTQIWQKLKTEDPIIQDFTPAIRATEYIESLNFILRIIEQSTGFSSGTFSFDGQSVKTATEVISENTDTYQTRADNVLIVATALSDLLENCLYLGQYHEIYNGQIDVDIVIDFDDGVFTSKAERQNYAVAGKSAGLLSVRTAMKRAFGWDDDQAQAEYDKIQEEKTTSTPSAFQQYSEQLQYGPNETPGANDDEDLEDEDAGNAIISEETRRSNRAAARNQ